MDTNIAMSKLKKLPFCKSWQNTFVTKTKGIVNFRTGAVEATELGIFVYLPAASILQAYGNDNEFLSFRLENKNSDAYEYHLLPDKAENNNRRIAIMFMAELLKAAGLEFMIDDAYTLYITEEELAKLHTSDDAGKREFYNMLYVPKFHGSRKGSEETFS